MITLAVGAPLLVGEHLADLDANALKPKCSPTTAATLYVKHAVTPRCSGAPASCPGTF